MPYTNKILMDARNQAEQPRTNFDRFDVNVVAIILFLTFDLNA